jgi:hypothetical protein
MPARLGWESLNEIFEKSEGHDLRELIAQSVARESAALIVRGILQRSPDGVLSVVADKLEPLGFAGAHQSRDFR